MTLLLAFKILTLVIATSLAVIALIRLGKKKEHFQIFPDSIKKEYFKEVRTMTILNIVSVILLFASLLITSYLSFVLIMSSMFLSVNSLIQLQEEFGDFNDNDDKK